MAGQQGMFGCMMYTTTETATFTASSAPTATATTSTVIAINRNKDKTNNYNSRVYNNYTTTTTISNYAIAFYTV